MLNSHSPPAQNYFLISAESVEDIRHIKKMLADLSAQLRELDGLSPLKGYLSEDEAKVKFKRGTTWFWTKRQEGLPSTKVGSTNYYPVDQLWQFFLKDNEKGTT